MSDQGRWFKLWVTADDDPDLANLSNEDFGRWCKLGVYLKKHGRDGRVTIQSPATALLERFKAHDLEHAVNIIRSFPNCVVGVTRDVTNAIVTLRIRWRNWRKFQSDSSVERTRTYRERRTNSVTEDVTPIEEKRREEKRTIPRGTFAAFWDDYPERPGGRGSRKACEEIWQRDKCEPKGETILAALTAFKADPQWRKDGGQFIPMAQTWLRQRRYEAPPALNGPPPKPANTVDIPGRGAVPIDEAKAKGWLS